MIRKISIKLLHKIRYLLVLPFVLVIGLVTLPLTLFFDWNGIWILCIAHEECCSLSEAKRMFLKNQNIKCDKSHYIDNVNFSYSFSENSTDIFNNSTGISSYSDQLRDELYSPCYAHHVSNIYHNTHN